MSILTWFIFIFQMLIALFFLVMAILTPDVYLTVALSGLGLAFATVAGSTWSETQNSKALKRTSEKLDLLLGTPRVSTRRR